jgi:hypothetical protein
VECTIDAAANTFCIEFQKFIDENLKLDQIHNASECLLYRKGSPAGTLAFEKDKCAPRHKSSKEFPMVVCCEHACRNHKLKLKAIGKAKKPCLFKGTEENCVHVNYGNLTGSWMDREITEN